MVDPSVGNVAEGLCAKEGEVCFDFLVWVEWVCENAPIIVVGDADGFSNEAGGNVADLPGAEVVGGRREGEWVLRDVWFWGPICAAGNGSAVHFFEALNECKWGGLGLLFL